MQWIHHYQLFLFDFDGILVNTEELHYKAYLKMCADRGFFLPWDLKMYMKYAMYSATGVREGIYDLFPDLKKAEPSWDILYQEKKNAYYTLLQTEGTVLMPGVGQLLEILQQRGVARCVVTHSPSEQITLIRQQHPILDTIPNWFTREHYTQPKPHPECYQKALAQLKKRGDRIIGFEDSPRGLKALLGTDAEGVLLSPFFSQTEITQLVKTIGRTFSHFETFLEMFEKHEG